MSSGRKTVVAFASLLGGLVLVILGLVTDWPLWLWPAMGIPLIVGPALLVRATAPPPDPLDREFSLEPDLPIPPPERREQAVSGVLLPTSAPDYDFRFSATVRWCPVEAPVDAPAVSLSGLAVRTVLERAHHVTSTHPPHRASLTQHELAGELGIMRRDATGRVLAMAENVDLSLSEADATRLDRLATVRKEEEVWTHERKYECDRRDYLGKDVLKNTGSAVVWWLAKNDDKVRQAVDEIGPLAQLSSAANDQDVPERYLHMVPYPQPVPETDPDVSPPDHAHEHSTANGFDIPRDAEGRFVAAGNGYAHANGATPPSAPRTPGECFDALLESMGVAAGHSDARTLRHFFVDAATTIGRAEAVDDLRGGFAPPDGDLSDDREGGKESGQADEGPEAPNGSDDDGAPPTGPPPPA
jgi:hypothetical protein